jgi:hypothetical protein
LKFELYDFHAEVNGTGFPLAYLFLENNGNCSGLIRTDVIAQFLIEIRLRKHIEPKFFLTDKDFAQISAAQRAWPSIKIQLCRWHMQRAIETKLKDSKKAQQIHFLYVKNSLLLKQHLHQQ